MRRGGKASGGGSSFIEYAREFDGGAEVEGGPIVGEEFGVGTEGAVAGDAGGRGMEGGELVEGGGAGLWGGAAPEEVG